MEKKDKNLNVPNLRFPEFSGEWEIHKLSDYLDFKNGLNPDAKRFGRGLPFISVMDILADRVICYDNIRAKVEATDKEIECFGVNKGDLLFQRSSETFEDVGRANVYMDNRTAIYGGFVIRGRKIGNYDPLFFRYLLATPLARKRTCRMGAGAQHFNIGQEGLSKISLHFPSIEEQSKIANLFSLIDERVETQKKIIEKYESLIRGLCEQLTRQGTKNKAINECLDCHTSTLQESSVSGTGEYPVYGATGVCGYTNFNDVKDDGILIIKDGASVGTTYYARGSYSHIGTLNRLTARKGVNLRYVYYCLKVMNFAPYKTGLAIPHIYFKDYGKHRIWCPSYEEQLHIANILTQIDDKIHVEKSLLEQLNSQKRYMLGQLFI